ncbi:MAG: hypothetical protein AB8B93_10580 [Pseudomonadales bacterium]
MRYFVQYLLPILVVVAAVYLGTRGRYSTPKGGEGQADRRTFLIIFAIGAAVATLLGFLFYQYMES